ncbi:MAG: ARMT1-like domain-containing protein [Bacteroidales bacterium]|nr:ARMT1-like domain-containing protein [Bacteroidales bacterium]MDD4822727.1 ARMT1-like domain-containing protein [Bacteroidales bacterium]
MISDYRCFYCFVKAFEKVLERENFGTKLKLEFTKNLANLYVTQNDPFSAPAFSRSLHNLLKQYTNDRDSYTSVKKESNDIALKLYPEMKERIVQAENPFDVAIRLAIAGNIMDAAIYDRFDVKSTIDKTLSSAFAIDHSDYLNKDLLKAKKVLYIGDNAGEIVFDKLFIETIRHPDIKFSVRGKPVINDATMEDAEYIGMRNVADVISNGSDAPSTILDHCSDEFCAVFDEADLIISKGQGNLEGLINNKNKNIYFLLMVKCDVIADALNVKKGDFVVMNNRMI